MLCNLIQNERLKGQLDELFIERKNQEEQIGAIDSQLQDIHHTAELKLNELDPEQRNEYESLLNENRQLIQDINVQRAELEEVNMVLAQTEAKLRVIIFLFILFFVSLMNDIKY